MGWDERPVYHFRFVGGISACGAVVRTRLNQPLFGSEAQEDHIQYQVDDAVMLTQLSRTMSSTEADLIDVMLALYIADRQAPRHGGPRRMQRRNSREMSGNLEQSRSSLNHQRALGIHCQRTLGLELRPTQERWAGDRNPVNFTNRYAGAGWPCSSAQRRARFGCRNRSIDSGRLAGTNAPRNDRDPPAHAWRGHKDGRPSSGSPRWAATWARRVVESRHFKRRPAQE